MADLTAFLDEDQRRYVEARVAAGDFPDAAAQLRAGVQMLQDEEELEAEKEARFERLIQEAEDDMAAGRFTEVTDINAYMDGVMRRARAKA